MKQVAESVRARLLNLSRESNVPFNGLLEQYATGRFLWRLSQSRYRTRFFLKGAQLFRIWGAAMHRPTRDVDFLSYGDSSEEGIAAAFEEICQLPCNPEDGLIWGKVCGEPIRGDVKYGGIRAQLQASLAGVRILLQIDVGFGDAITPGALESEWAGLLNFPAASLLVYPPETVIAGKMEAAVTLGIRNSRMKDFFDMHWLSRHLSFDAEVLKSAIAATFERRGTKVPQGVPLALTDDFANDPNKQTQWKAFLRKSDLEFIEFAEVIAELRKFIVPLLGDDEGIS
jgi:hypothetical protein